MISRTSASYRAIARPGSAPERSCASSRRTTSSWPRRFAQAIGVAHGRSSGRDVAAPRRSRNSTIRVCPGGPPTRAASIATLRHARSDPRRDRGTVPRARRARPWRSGAAACFPASLAGSDPCRARTGTRPSRAAGDRDALRQIRLVIEQEPHERVVTLPGGLGQRVGIIGERRICLEQRRRRRDVAEIPEDVDGTPEPGGDNVAVSERAGRSIGISHIAPCDASSSTMRMSPLRIAIHTASAELSTGGFGKAPCSSSSFAMS